MSYADMLKPIRRRIILEFLARSQFYISNAEIIVTVINGTRDGVTAYHSDVVSDLRWLQEKGYVTLSGEDVIVAEATAAGLRVARGEEVDEGIEPPRPRA